MPGGLRITPLAVLAVAANVTAVRADEYNGAKAPDDGTYTAYRPRGVTSLYWPKGVDYGWDYAPGATWKPDVASYPEPIQEALKRI